MTEQTVKLRISTALDPLFLALLEEYPAELELYRDDQADSVGYEFVDGQRFCSFLDWAVAQQFDFTDLVSQTLHEHLMYWKDQCLEQRDQAINPAEQATLFDTDLPTKTPRALLETDTVKKFKRNFSAVISQVMIFFYEGQDGMHWYEETPKRIAEFFNNDPERTDLFLRFLAATSPLRNIRENVRGALQALNQFDHGARFAPDYVEISRKEYDKAFKAGDQNVYFKHFFDKKTGQKGIKYLRIVCPPESALKAASKDKYKIKCADDSCCFDLAMPNHETNAARTAQDIDLSGPKVSAFYKNLTTAPELDDSVTVDTWMLKAFGFRAMDASEKSEKGAPSKAEYEVIANTVRDLAAEVGVTPRQFQAAVWVGVKRMYGNVMKDTDEPFEVVLEREARTLAQQGEFGFADEPVQEIAERRRRQQDALMRETVFNPEDEDNEFEYGENPLPDLESWGVWPNVVEFVTAMPDGPQKGKVINALKKDPALPLIDVEKIAAQVEGKKEIEFDKYELDLIDSAKRLGGIEFTKWFKFQIPKLRTQRYDLGLERTGVADGYYVYKHDWKITRERLAWDARTALMFRNYENAHGETELKNRINNGLYVSFFVVPIFGGIRDWIEGTREQLHQYSWEEAMDAAAAWHATCNIGGSEKYNDTDETVFEYPDGWTIKRITDPHNLEVEGTLMGHCVGSYAGRTTFQLGSDQIYSLRDAKNKPHVTIELHAGGSDSAIAGNTDVFEIEQIQGKGNDEPIPEYKDRVRDWLSTLDASWVGNGRTSSTMDSLDNFSAYIHEMNKGTRDAYGARSPREAFKDLYRDAYYMAEKSISRGRYNEWSGHEITDDLARFAAQSDESGIEDFLTEEESTGNDQTYDWEVYSPTEEDFEREKSEPKPDPDEYDDGEEDSDYIDDLKDWEQKYEEYRDEYAQNERDEQARTFLPAAFPGAILNRFYELKRQAQVSA